MRRYFLLTAVLCAVLTAWAERPGIPQAPRLRTWHVAAVASDDAAIAPAGPAAALQRPETSDYYLLDRISFEEYLLPGQSRSVAWSPASRRLELGPSPGQAALNETALAAVARAPRWLQQELRLKLSLLTDEYQSLWSGGILAAEDPYIDEVAFAVAFSSPQYLMSGYGSPQLFLENAQSIYAHDADLDYVEVVDYGTSATDPDYYTTTRYKSVHASVLVDVEAPRDIYYWYLVYPRATSEIPAYIDPAISESNSLRNNNLAAPPAGRFWRDFLFNYADPGYPVLRDQLKGCKVLFDGTRGKPDANQTAMGRLNTWMEKTLQFDSGEERPHQPVRIYRVHMGRCGEWSDLRNAAARSALIPCTSIASYSTDHVWNEFWDREWYHWDNETNYPLMYILGWGKVFGTVFEIRSDGRLTSVTNRYARGICYLDIRVVDSAGKPVDGAGVDLYTKDASGELWWDMYALTDDQGRCTFMVGKDRSYYATVSSAIGDYPRSGGVVEIIAGAISGRDYAKLIKMTTARPAPLWKNVPPPADTQEDYFLEVEFSAPQQLRAGPIRFDDVRLGASFYQPEDDGSIDFYFADSAGYARAAAGQAFNAVGLLPDSASGHGWLGLPQEQSWHAVFANAQNLRNVEQVHAIVRLFARAALPAEQPFACTANWNWISLNLQPSSLAVADVLAPLAGNGLRLKSAQGEARYESGKGWSGTLQQLESGKGYLLQLAAEQTFSVTGPAVPAGQSLALEKGWNWIACLPQVALPIEEALASISGSLYQIKGQKQSAMYIDGRWIGDLTTLQPGAMYKINLHTAATLTYPDPQPALGKAAAAAVEDDVLSGTPGNMVVIARITASHPFNLAIVVDEQGRRRGYGHPIPGTGLYYFTIVGEAEGEALAVELRVSPMGYQTNCKQKISFREDATLGSLTAPLQLSDSSLDFALAQNHPNPFNNSTTVAYTLAERGQARLVIYNRLGQQCRLLYEGLHDAGESSVTWDGTDDSGRPLAAGLYLVELTAGSQRQSRKMVLLR